MHKPAKVIDVELSQPIQDVMGLASYQNLVILIRWHDRPIGLIRLPVSGDRCEAATIVQAIANEKDWPVARQLLAESYNAGWLHEHMTLEELFNSEQPIDSGPLPLVTVVVCTRDRTSDLTLCLEALCQLDYPALDLLVVDNAPTSDATKNLVQHQYADRVRYVCEPMPGLDRARNRGILEARGEIVAYTDDDVIVDRGWVRALVTVFNADPNVMGVTGLVISYELETEAQHLFEQYGGFGRGCERLWFRTEYDRPNVTTMQHGGTGKFGTGANMAYRRHIFEEIGYFDPALDVGTVTNGGGDLDMFYRILKEGYILVYEPAALVRHRHRREYEKLRTQLANNGIGLYAYLVRTWLAYPDERWGILYLGIWWLWRWSIRRLIGSYIRPTSFPRDLILAEFRGIFAGLTRYQKAQRAIQDEPIGRLTGPRPAIQRKGKGHFSGKWRPTAVRAVNLAEGLADITDVSDYDTVRLYVNWERHALGMVEVNNYGRPVSALELQDQIWRWLGIPLLAALTGFKENNLISEIKTHLRRQFGNPISTAAALPVDVPVSVILATHDRPADLRECLHSLTAQKTERPVEIVVVDNNPSSGITPPVVAEFPGIVFVTEPRKGLAYARNAGFNASTGDILLTTDDDVIAPPDWLEGLVAPFVRNDVMVVTGNVLPYELETPSQHLFEAYGGLGRGFGRIEVDQHWFTSPRFRAIRTWQLGATANAAFRATVFSHPAVGLMNEALGPGMPTGVGEDTYLFYKILKAGFTIVYEPTAYLWHKHRRTIKALRRQLFNYSKGHVAYHLTTLLRDRDLRSLVRLGYEMPYGYLWQLKEWILGRRNYKLHFLALEIIGNLLGPVSLWQAQRRVKRLGRSAPYIPVAARNKRMKPEAARTVETVQDGRPAKAKILI